jgi:hypothetical protein
MSQQSIGTTVHNRLVFARLESDCEVFTQRHEGPPAKQQTQPSDEEAESEDPDASPDRGCWCHGSTDGDEQDRTEEHRSEQRLRTQVGAGRPRSHAPHLPELAHDECTHADGEDAARRVRLPNVGHEHNSVHRDSRIDIIMPDLSRTRSGRSRTVAVRLLAAE